VINQVYKISVAPSVEPMSLADAKTHLRVDASDDDDYITALIKAVRLHAERITGRGFITQTWEMRRDTFPASNSIKLRYAPLQSITSLIYKDSDGTDNTWASSNYVVDTYREPGLIILEDGVSWPSDTLYETGGVRVLYVLGYGDAASDLDEDLIHVMKLHLTVLFECRAPISEIKLQPVPLGYHALLEQFRIHESW